MIWLVMFATIPEKVLSLGTKKDVGVWVFCWCMGVSLWKLNLNISCRTVPVDYYHTQDEL